MRLVAVEFEGVRAPVARGYLELADVTVLFGANDAGKTRMLNTIASTAQQLDALTRGSRPTLPRSRIFVEFSVDELEAILGFNLLEEPPSGERPWLVVHKEPWDWWRRESRGHRDLCRRLRTLVLEASDREGDTAPMLMASWCDSVMPKASLLGPAFEMQLPLFPAPTQLPSPDPEWLRREVTDALLTWLIHIRWAIAGARGAAAVADAFEMVRAFRGSAYDSEGDPTHTESLYGTWVEQIAYPFVGYLDDPPPPADIWGTELSASDSAAPQPIGAIACAHISAIATGLAPPFVKSRYRIRVEPPIGSSSLVRILLETLDGKHRFPHADMADGLRLWVEIAVLEGASAMRRVELNLRRALRAIEIEVDNHNDELPPEESLLRAMDRYLRLLNEALTSPIDPPPARSVAVGMGLSADLDTSNYADEFPNRDLARAGPLAAARPRLYVLDEPERHLNPRLQRAAATWLIDLLRTRDAQSVIATHSPAFLNAGHECRFVGVRRTNDNSSELQPFLPEELTRYSEMARTLGFDRGELLATCRVLLFVEGRHDRAIVKCCGSGNEE